MPDNSPTPPPRPITARAAENGLRIGGYLCVLVLATGLASVFPASALVVWGGSIGLPFYLYRLLNRSHSTDVRPGLPELWAEGIASFFLGSLLPALLTYVLLRFVAPGFIAGTFAEAAVAFESLGTPQGDHWAEVMRDLLESKRIPTAADAAAQLISFNIIAGTALSLPAALIVKLRHSLRVMRR